MKKVLLYSMLLVGGLAISQVLPGWLTSAQGAGVADGVAMAIRLATMTALAFIMIHVGIEFDIDKRNLGQYGWDYVVAATAAAFPWLLCALYFVFVLLPRQDWGAWPAWKESLLASRFAAPTSAGVLFSMLAAAGLGATWLFKKARILAIFDDLDTVLLMIPLKMMMVGVRWQLGVVILAMAVQIALAWKFLHAWRISCGYIAVMCYSLVIVAFTEAIHIGSLRITPDVPIHLEVLLPAFVLGCIIKADHDTLAAPREQTAMTVISAAFMLLVGLSMPAVFGAAASPATTDATVAATSNGYAYLRTHTPEMGWGAIALHVMAITVISNIGKMFPAFCYRKEATFKERLALAIGMWPRGEVGAGVLVISLSYGIGGPIVTIAMLSLALNLVLTGVFILIIKRLIRDVMPTNGGADAAAPSGAH